MANLNQIKWPHHIAFELTHNPHKVLYQTAKQYIDLPGEFHSPRYFDDNPVDQLKKCIELDEIWELVWYPETPIGHCRILTYSLESLIQLINEVHHD